MLAGIRIDLEIVSVSVPVTVVPGVVETKPFLEPEEGPIGPTAPLTPEVPDEPETPDVPEDPELPAAPVAPACANNDQFIGSSGGGVAENG